MVINECDKEYIERGVARICVCKKCSDEYIYRKYKSNSSASYCPNCAKAIAEKKKQEDPRDKYEKRFDEAVDVLRDTVRDINIYKQSIETAKKRMYFYGSIPEVLTAIMLLKLGYSIIPQQQVGKYIVDFLLPKQKMVIEVDGELYHRRKTHREAEIQIMLGMDWKIIHIPSELIRCDATKLKEYIDIYGGFKQSSTI